MLGSRFKSSEGWWAFPSLFAWIAGAFSIAAIVGSVCFPIALLLEQALSPSASISIVARIGDASLWPIVRFTWQQAALSTLLSASLGMFAAYLASEHWIPGIQFLDRIALVAWSAPSLVVAILILEAFQQVGIQAYGWLGILSAHVFFNAPLFYRRISLSMREFDRLEECVAVSLGMKRRSVFLRITLRKLLPEILSTTCLCFLLCSLSFVVVLILGGSPHFSTIEVAIFRAIRNEFDLRLAVGLASVQLFTGIALTAARLILERARIPSAAASLGRNLFQWRFPQGSHFATLLLWTIFSVGLFFPVGTFVWKSLLALPGLSWGDFGVDLSQAVGRSLGLAITTAILTTSLVWTLALLRQFRWPDFLSVLPMGLSPTLILISWTLAFPFWRWQAGTQLFTIAWAQSFFALPFCYPLIRDGLVQLPMEWRHTVTSLGASPWQILRTVEWPKLWPTTKLAFALAAGFSLGESSCVLLFSQEGPNTTLPVWIYQRMARYQVEEAMIASCILFVLVGLLYGYADGRRKFKH